VFPQLVLLVPLLVEQVLRQVVQMALELLQAFRLLVPGEPLLLALVFQLVLDMALPALQQLELLDQQVLQLALPLGLRLFVFDFDRP
jgi:hypothetical protein